VGALLLTLILVCGGVAFFGFRAAKDMFNQISSATGTAESFLNQIQAGHLPAAYRVTSQTYQASHTQQQFEKFVAQFPILTEHTNRTAGSFNMMKMNGIDQFRIQYTLTAPNNGLTCTLTLVEENGAWMVDSFTVP
jgi:hypothetical protein